MTGRPWPRPGRCRLHSRACRWCSRQLARGRRRGVGDSWTHCSVFCYRTGSGLLVYMRAMSTRCRASKRLMELPEQVPGAEASQFKLLGKRRFLPFFLTQFLGAFNDNLFRNAVVVSLTFGVAASADAGVLANVSQGLFILPFFLFSALSGQLADKYEKSRLIRQTRFAEVVLMCCGAAALYIGQVSILLGVIFLLGVLATIFGPLKYSLMPQHLRQSELVGGNALVDAGTFIAILVGTIVGGLLAPTSAHGGGEWRRCASRGRGDHGGRGGRHVPVRTRHSARGSHRSRSQGQLQPDHVDLGSDPLRREDARDLPLVVRHFLVLAGGRADPGAAARLCARCASVATRRCTRCCSPRSPSARRSARWLANGSPATRWRSASCRSDPSA